MREEGNQLEVGFPLLYVILSEEGGVSVHIDEIQISAPHSLMEDYLYHFDRR